MYKKTIFKSLKKEILKAIKRIYWYNYTSIKYLYLTIIFKISLKKIKKYKIALLCPTRERSKKFLRMLESLKKNSSDIGRIELLVLCDEDEPEIDNYFDIIKKNKLEVVNLKFFKKSFLTNAERHNFLAKKSNSNLFIAINDDIIFPTEKWDDILDIEFSKVGNEPYCLWINNNQKYLYLHCDFPIINDHWYKRLGYIGSEHFKFWYLDTWICDLCLKSKKFFVTSKIKIFQYSANTFKNEVDNTHLKNIKDGIPENDYQTWINTEKKRNEEAKLLI
tara:strand:+ start:2853 stop:3683 length:831 start_codon:yes stop_codon:yes gene_type:complete